MMRDLSLALKRYQQRIGTYDQHDWERSVEQKLLEGLGGPIPKKTVKLLPQLIDVDLIRGSAFGKAKPLVSFVGVTWLGVKAALLFPLWWRWWLKHIGPTLVRLVFLAYCLQIGVLAHYLAHHNGASCAAPNDQSDSGSPSGDNGTEAGSDDDAVAACEDADFALLTGTEVVSCIILMISLSVLHAHMTSTQRHVSTAACTPASESSTASHSSGCSSTAYWSPPCQQHPSAVGGLGVKAGRQKGGGLGSHAAAARWRRAISEDPSFRPRPPSVVAQQEEKSSKDIFSGDEEEDEAEDEECASRLQSTGGRKQRLKTSRQLLRIRRKSCGTMTAQGTTDIDGDIDKNSSCESSECPSSFSLNSPKSDSVSPNGDVGDGRRKIPEERSPRSRIRGTGDGGEAQSSNVSEIDYWSGATTNSEEDCCNCTSTELDDDDDGVGRAATSGAAGGKRRLGEKPGTAGLSGVNASAFFQESLFFPFDCSGSFSTGA